MTNVILISEENHGTIGIAIDEEVAKQWLLDTEWITGYTEMWKPTLQNRSFLCDLYGENWKEEYMKFDAGQMENLGFYFKEIELIQ